ncbi:hypothetical protein DSCW_30690 [Desulfosarcina widdelii]|uniref:Uncharacterized protein n=1 Tax=Desulfosarcina widdelii TaxID=947919 RepID=A0A5K7Z0Z9_9BACT|nr:hypothetical protein DSCW_30690 [Desulfosarcina widdelii]
MYAEEQVNGPDVALKMPAGNLFNDEKPGQAKDKRIKEGTGPTKGRIARANQRGRCEGPLV